MTISQKSEDPGMSADVHIPSASPWFKGHFPDHPLLPGIAQLGMVLDLIRQSSGGVLGLRQIRRVRYKKMILPDDRIHIEVVPKADQKDQDACEYAFRIMKNEELVTSGNLIVGPDPASNSKIL